MSNVKFLSIRQALEGIVKEMVSFEKDVKTDEELDELGVKISLYCNQEDASKVVGKEGATIKALRKIISVCGAKKKARLNLFLIEPWKNEDK